MKLINAIRQPYYLFRPAQIARRVRFSLSRPQASVSAVLLPWGLSIRCRPSEELGRSLHTTGIYDLALTEMLCRTVERGDTAIDVGANIGYATGLIAALAGSRATVYSFEPHPELFAELEANVRSWFPDRRLAQIKLLQLALSDTRGMALLREPGKAFEHNRGLATLARGSADDGRAHLVSTWRLDEVAGLQEASIGVLKVDVEGHELEVLQGAETLLRRGRIRDVIFEEFHPYPAPTHDFLQGFGYTIFHLEPGLLRPHLLGTKPGYEPPKTSPPNYLASIEPVRVTLKFQAIGWRFLGTVL